jgi:O-acetyl-ADP-ribose deacetylase (regulator of RNase III)
MITYEGPGNIFLTGLQTLVCPVNTVGVMGAGLAKAFKERYPGLLVSYNMACMRGGLTISKPFVFPIADGKQVLCFATKQDWRDPSDIRYIQKGLAYLVKHYQELQIESLSLPMLGCGLGGLHPSEVMPLLHNALDPLPIPVEILTSGEG